MYGHPSMTAFGPERVSSVSELAEAIKRRQLLKPAGRYGLLAGGASFAVGLLPSGHIEIDGTVPPLHLEREFDAMLRQSPALVEDITEAACTIV